MLSFMFKNNHYKHLNYFFPFRNLRGIRGKDRTIIKQKYLLSLLVFLLIIVPIFAQQSLESGKPISVGSKDGLGPLSTQGVLNIPVGVASVFNSGQSDLFVRTGRFGREKGLYLFPWLKNTKDGTPIFGKSIRISHPFGNSYPPPGNIFQSSDGIIHGFWLQDNQITHTIYNKEKHNFFEISKIIINDLPHNPKNLVVLPNSESTYDVILEIPDGLKSRPDDFSSRDKRYRPFDGAGIWRGGLPFVCLYSGTIPSSLDGNLSNVRLVSKSDQEVLYSYHQLTRVNLGVDRENDIITGSRFGGLYYYKNNFDKNSKFESRLYLVGENGNAHRHPIIEPSPVSYPDPISGLSNLIVGGEGGLYFYKFTGLINERGNPVYEDPDYVFQANTNLYSGTLPVPTVVDWNGDNKLDIIAGNSEGNILFFENVKSNASPMFLQGVPIKANNQIIHIQAGYRMDIQGPAEARWGYTCPTVSDWNNDGLLDILMSDCTAKHTIYLNNGTKYSPKLNAGHPIFVNDLDFHGTWRVRPAVAKLGKQMAYVALDDDDEFHLYWQIDDYNLEDGGKLYLEDKSVIQANFLHAGGSGRLKLNLSDWDLDGLIDLLVGTPRHGSVPNPDDGLPQSLGLPGAAILFLKNINTNDNPVFAYPKLMKFRGNPIYLGQHSCSPTPAYFNSDKPDLIVGEESGRFIYYNREDLSW